MTRLWANLLYPVLSVLLLWQPVQGQERDPEFEAFRQSFLNLQEKDALVAAIGWKLASGNARFCPQTNLQTGLVLQDAAAFARPDWVRRIAQIDSDIFINATVSEARTAAAIPRIGTEIRSIGARDIATFAANEETPWARLLDIKAFIDHSLADDNILVFGLATGSPMQIKAERVCHSRFEVITGRAALGADGTLIRVGSKFTGFTYPEDEFAAALAHELAHNILKHPQWLNANGRKRLDIRRTEREADRLTPWLLANAGYDPEAAARFMQRWGPANNGGIRLLGQHDGWDERIALIQAEIPKIANSIAAHQAANWPADFERQFPRQ